MIYSRCDSARCAQKHAVWNKYSLWWLFVYELFDWLPDYEIYSAPRTRCSTWAVCSSRWEWLIPNYLWRLCSGTCRFGLVWVKLWNHKSYLLAHTKLNFVHRERTPKNSRRLSWHISPLLTFFSSSELLCKKHMLPSSISSVWSLGWNQCQHIADILPGHDAGKTWETSIKAEDSLL